MREYRLRWFGHVQRRSANTLVRLCELINIWDYKRGRGLPKKSWNEVIKYV